MNRETLATMKRGYEQLLDIPIPSLHRARFELALVQIEDAIKAETRLHERGVRPAACVPEPAHGN